MWPSIFEFHWDTGHMIFLGIFYAVVITIATSLAYVFVKSVIDTFSGNGDTDKHELADGRAKSKSL